MNSLNRRIRKLEIKAIPPAKHIVFIQDEDNPDLFTSLDTLSRKNRYDLTTEQARAMINPGDSVTWILLHENAIGFEGPGAEELAADFEEADDDGEPE